MEVLMKVLGYLLVRLGSRLVKAVAEALTIWSLDTVNTDPLTQIARASQRWISRVVEQGSVLKKDSLTESAAI
jgi:hypothetical protein